MPAGKSIIFQKQNREPGLLRSIIWLDGYAYIFVSVADGFYQSAAICVLAELAAPFEEDLYQKAGNDQHDVDKTGRSRV